MLISLGTRALYVVKVRERFGAATIFSVSSHVVCRIYNMNRIKVIDKSDADEANNEIASLQIYSPTHTHSV